MYIVSVEEQTAAGGDEWIDTTRGRANIDYDDEDDTESSTYFRNQSSQGQKRKKAPYFKYSKKRKAGSNSKGSVSFVSHFIFRNKIRFKVESLFS